MNEKIENAMLMVCLIAFGALSFYAGFQYTDTASSDYIHSNFNYSNNQEYDLYLSTWEKINETNRRISQLNFDCVANIPECPACPDNQCGTSYITTNGCEGEFEKIAKNMAQEKDYELNRYDCTEFADNLAGRYNQLGWRAQTKRVQVDCESPQFSSDTCREYDGWHLIVKVNTIYLEAVTGDVIHPDEYKVYGIN